MKALIYPEYGRLEVGEWPEPHPGPGEALVQVAACGICGSELGSFAAQSRRRVPPMVMGHEFAGTIAALGEGVEGLILGQRVVVNSVVHCGECDLCRRGLTHLCRRRQVFGMHRSGAFAERVSVPANIVYPLPESVTSLQGALVEPLANGIHVVDLARGNDLETVLVCGAGTIGLFSMQAARAAGAQRVAATDTNPHRLEMARQMGADAVWNPAERNVAEAALAWTDGEGVSLAIDAVGTPDSRRDTIRAARPGGDIVWIGLHHDEATLNTFDVVLPEKRIIGSYAATDADLRRAIQLFAARRIRIDPWVETFPLERGDEVFLAMLRQELPAIKAVLVP
ncbi:MAG: alcohol dehydrogenase catalytic domain-containing protein [Armatimonadetes bacterium]|nr:alcohol dehydrogenase catalytic domain-containing protein [Armatimonadota bacterium]